MSGIPSLGPFPSKAMRVSQRKPLACQECTKHKRRCSKDIPCSRCRRLNLNCSREAVQLRRNTVRFGDEIKFLSSLVGDLEMLRASTPSSSQQLPQILSRVRSRISHLQTGDDVPQQQPEEVPTTLAQTSDSKRKSSSPELNDSSILTAIEHLAWGRNSAGCFPHNRCGCEYSREGTTKAKKFYFIGPSVFPDIPITDAAGAEKLVRLHICRLAWHHNCIHTPTFLEQCEIFWKTGQYDHPLWIALYFSVLGSTIFSIRNSNKTVSSSDIDLDALPSAEELFTGMLRVLYSCNFLHDISIYSVQAIVISTEVAHNLGFSQLNATLFNAAVRIAECLGLHRIKDSTTEPVESREKWIEKVQREVGKRVWCQMIIQDHFAITFTDTYSISPSQYSTGSPLNADDHDLREMPVTVPTVSTYVRVLRDIAALMPSLIDGLGPMGQPKSLRDQYEHILHLDNRMRSVVKGIPSFLLRRDREKEARIPWLGIARRSLAITAAEKIIMIHRPFLFRSFYSHSYNHTRQTCVAAAMTILREHETIFNEGDLFIWTHSAFCITAAIILCFEDIVTRNSTEPATEDYRAAIFAARSRLATQKSDVLAQRGVALIDTIFSSESKLDVDFNRIVADFLRLSKPDIGLSSRFPLSADLFPDGTTGELVHSDTEMQIPLDEFQVDVDFETWFNNVFYHLSDHTP